MLNKKYSKFLFWAWEVLSMIGAKPYTKIARWMLIVTTVFFLMPPLMWVIYSIILPLWLSAKYSIKGQQWPWYILAILPVVVWIATPLFTECFLLFVSLVGCASIASFTGFIFNRYIAPKMAAVLAEMIVQQEIENGTFNYDDDEELAYAENGEEKITYSEDDEEDDEEEGQNKKAGRTGQ